MEQPTNVSNPPHQSGSDETYKYKMDYPEKGLCVIINMMNFSSALPDLKPRQGTDIDEKSLTDVFETIGFQVQIERDKTCDEILNIMEKVASDDHSNRSCFVCVVMSHGNENGFYGFDDFFQEDKLFELFNGANSRSLAGKPKLFFLQKCSGNKLDMGVTLHAGTQTSGTRIPTEADFLYHFSSSSGYVSFRRNGSWFMQSLCEVLKKYWNKEELLHILTLVNNKVAFEYQTRDGIKQSPCVVSTLTKFVYL